MTLSQLLFPFDYRSQVTFLSGFYDLTYSHPPATGNDAPSQPTSDLDFGAYKHVKTFVIMARLRCDNDYGEGPWLPKNTSQALLTSF